MSIVKKVLRLHPPLKKKKEKQIETLHFGKQEEFKDDG